jgi:hypothetical protein
MKEHLFDKRVVTRALQEGLLDKELYQRMLDELPDLSHKVQTAAESQALEAASQASALSYGADDDDDLDDDDLDDEDDDDLDDEADDEAPAAPALAPVTDTNAAPVAGETLEMERPRIPGSYDPNNF